MHCCQVLPALTWCDHHSAMSVVCGICTAVLYGEVGTWVLEDERERCSWGAQHIQGQGQSSSFLLVAAVLSSRKGLVSVVLLNHVGFM